MVTRLIFKSRGSNHGAIAVISICENFLQTLSLGIAKFNDTNPWYFVYDKFILDFFGQADDTHWNFKIWYVNLGYRNYNYIIWYYKPILHESSKLES